MSGTPITSKITIEGPAGRLEALLDEPHKTGTAVAVVCHPHPLYGGNMTNKVTHILARTFNDLGTPAVRFNFRGVGQSMGVHDDGRGETEDALAALEWARTRWPDRSLWLAGFSFGAAVALRASLRQRVDRLITVAPALRWLQQVAEAPACPWLIVQGDQDELVDAQAVQSWAAQLPQPPTIRLLPDAEHFFHGRLTELRDVVKEWLAGSNSRGDQTDAIA